MLLETALVFLGTIGILRGVYSLRFLPGLIPLLPLLFFVIQIGVPLLHVQLRRPSIRFFESNFKPLFRSLRFFLSSSLIIFSLFLLASHLYFTFVMHQEARWHPPHFELRILLSQLLLVALPEEFFFRGWLQAMIRKRLGGSLSIVVASLLFAFAHSVIAFQWWHFAIFFPSLVFGWLREKTGAITAPILFHAASNLINAWIQQCYL